MRIDANSTTNKRQYANGNKSTFSHIRSFAYSRSFVKNSRKFAWILAISVLLILGPMVYFGIIKPNKVTAGWFNDMWAYRKAITFNNSGAAVTNQKVKLDVNTATAVDPQTANFNTADLTFTPNMAKRNATNVGTTAPFAAGVMATGNLNVGRTADIISYSQGTWISTPANRFSSNFDSWQGSMVLWITPEWNGNDGIKHIIFTSQAYNINVLYKGTDGKLYWDFGWSDAVSTDVSSWTAGSTYNVVARWDRKNTLDGTKYLSISVNDSHTFGSLNAASDKYNGSLHYIGSDPVGAYPANALIEGLTIYRRPLYDGSYGINVGNGDEISQIFNSGVGQDPTLITGSWDVVFDLPTNSSTGSLGVGGTGSAWSHPHSSNVLYTSTTNTGGFMMNGTYTTDGWAASLFGNGNDGAVTISGSKNINTDNIGTGRTCADAINYSVIGLGSSAATLSSAVSSGCLTAGDEVLLINLQGTATGTTNVGNYETLRIQNAGVGTTAVIFTTAKTKFYGGASASDANIGVGSTALQKVMLQRVPNYTDVTVGVGTTFTASAWDGNKGGVLFFKASGTVTVNGVISANQLGFTDGSTYKGYGINGGGGGGGGGYDWWAPAGAIGIGGAGAGFGSSGNNGTNDANNGGNGGSGASGASGGNGGIGAYAACGGGAGGGGGSGNWGGAGGAGGGGGGAGSSASTAPGAGGNGGGLNNVSGDGGTSNCGGGSAGGAGGGGGGYGTGGGGGYGGAGDTANLYGFNGSTGSAGIGGSGNASIIVAGGAGGGGGAGGTTYGTSDLSTIFLGSPGANVPAGTAPGGIIGIVGKTITVDNSTGNITSNGNNAASGKIGGSSGGSIYMRGDSVTLGTDRVIASGGTSPGTAGSGGAGGVGRTASFSTPTVAALDASEKIYSGGYKVTSDGITANQGIGRTASIGVGSTGQNYVVRALANSDGTSIPKVQIWDNTNNAEITSLTGTVGSGRTAPDTLIFTFELPTIARNGVATSCTNFDVRLLNTQTSGTIYWHQVEVLTNLLDNPSLDVGSSTTGPWVPSGWGKNYTTGSGEGLQELTDKHSGISSFKGLVDSFAEGIYFNFGTDSFGNFRSFGAYGKKTSGSGTVPLSTSDYWNRQDGSGGLSVNAPASWSLIPIVGRRYFNGNTNLNLTSVGGGATFYFDDIYMFNLSPVSLTVTPASLTNSTESTGVRVDGRDTATASITNLTTTTGTIKFQYTPRHASSISNKFVESGIGTTDPAYIADFSGDSDDYIKLYWKTNNTLLLKYSMNGTGASAQSTSLSLGAGTSYPMTLTYLGGGTMALNVGISTNAIALTAIPAAFGTAPATAYWGTDSTGAYQGDATYAATTVATGVKMQNDCDDVRFTDQNGNLLDYYYDSTNGICNAESTDFYVLMPSINTGHNTVYMYYGNSSATKGSKTSNFSQTTFSQSSTTTATEEQSKAPVAYWKMDEGQGSIINDSGQARMTGTLGSGTSAPAWQTEDMCISGKCLKLDGNDYVSIGSTARDVMSISLWVRPATTAPTIIDLDGGTHYISATSNVVSATGFSSPTIYVNGRSNGTLTINQWNHIEVTTATSFNATSIKLGQRSTNFLTGFMDEVKLFAYARSVAEIKADYNSGKAKAGTSKGTTVGLGGMNQAGAGGLSDGLIAWWKMDEASWSGAAGEVVDSSGNSNHGVGVGSTIPTTGAGKFGNGGVFNGTDTYQYVNIAKNSTINNLPNSTISFWTKIDAFGGYRDLIGKGWAWYIYHHSSRQFYYCRVSSGAESCAISKALNANTWYHITAVSNQAEKKIRLYINGVEDYVSYAPNPGNLSANISDDSGDNLHISYNKNNYVNGTIDDIRFYNRALQPSEVRQLYEWAPGPVAYYNFNEGVGSSAYDTSGNGNPSGFSASGAPTWSTGKFGKALKFGGSGYATTSEVSTFSMANNNSFTMEAWIKTTQTSNSAFWTIRDINGVSGIQGILYNLSGKVRFDTYDWLNNNVVGNVTINDGKWHYIAGVFNNISSVASIYVDGVLDNSKIQAVGVGTTGNRRIIFGSNSGSWPTGSQFFNGLVDDSRFYNYARTQKQIVEDMNAGHPAGGSPVGSQVIKYGLDEGYGTTIRSSVSGIGGTAINGTLGAGASAPTWSNDGKYGKALSFDGGGDYAYTANTAMMAGNGQTYPTLAISTWVYPQTSAASKTILNKNSEFKMTTDANSKVNCAIYGNGSWQTASLSPSALSLNTWSHVLCNYDGTNIKTWINGVGGLNVGQTAQIVSLSSTPLNIAKDATALANYQGLIDEIKIYNYPLSQDEIYTDFNSGSSLILGSLSTGNSNPAPNSAGSQEYCVPGDTATNCSPPVGRWDFNEGVGTSAYDTSGNSNNGTLGTGNSAPTWTAGKFGKAVKFDGSNDTIVKSSAFSNSLGSTFSVIVWAKVDSSGGTPSKHIFDLRGSGSSTIAFRSAGNDVFVRAIDGTVTTPSLTYTNGVWANYALVANGTNVLTYKNGVLEDSHSWSSSVDITSYAFGSATGASNWYKGLIDDARIYNYARTPAQIAWDYNRGLPTNYFRFNECQGTTLHDSVSVGTTATINIGSLGTQSSAGTCVLGVGSSTSWGNGVTGKYSNSLSFDGTNDFVSVGAGTTVQSISLWVKPTTNTTSLMQLATGVGLSVNLGVITATGFASPTTYVNATPSATLSNNTWQMVTVTTATGIPASAIKLGLFGTGYFTGQIDEVKLWNYPLTAVQIKTEFNQDSELRIGPDTGSP